MTGTSEMIRAIEIDRDDPSEEFIQSLRDRYPVEDEIDRILTRKMRRRSGPAYQRIGMDELVAALNGLLKASIEGDYTISDTGWFTGGVSKIQLGFTLEWTDSDVGPRKERLVVRMEPSESSNTTSRTREAELINLVESDMPVPHVYWMDSEGTWFPEPAIIYGYVPGVTKPSQTTTGKISGLGTNFGPELREKLGDQFMRHLALIHAHPIPEGTLPSFNRPRLGETDSATWLVNHAMRVWDEDRGHANPLMEAAAQWLQDNVPVLDHASVLHGDYRSGNFLFDEEAGKITGWLDWERGHIGDRHRDLAWTTQKAFGHYSEDGTEYYICGLVPESRFYDQYQDLTGLTIDPERLDFYRILNCFQIIVSIQATSYRVARLGKSHQDIMLTRVEGMAPVMAEQMRAILERKI